MHSQLWGENGELWEPDGTHTKLLDFTDVGYRGGDVLPPEWPVGVNVRDFGAVGDGVADDTQAFVEAIAACPPHSAIFVPLGRYKITRQLSLDRDNIVLRGEDMFGTVLWFPKYLTEVYPYIVANQSPEARAASYDADGNSYDGRMIAEVGPPHDQNGNPVYDFAKNWPPRDHEYSGGFLRKKGGSEVGIENLSLEFREQPKGWHWEDIGADGILLWGVTNCWVRNVRVRNADHGITLRGANNVSLINLFHDAYTLRAGSSGASHGHAAIRLVDISRVLVHNVRVEGQYIHDIMLNGGSSDCVFSRISGDDLKLDHHSLGGERSLFTEIDHGKGTRAFSWSQWETYWGLKAEIPQTYDDVRGNREEMRNVVIGMHTNDPSKSGDDFWHETLDPDQLEPVNLYIAQMKKMGKPLPEYPFPEKPVSPLGPRDFFPVDDATVDPAMDPETETNLGRDWKLDWKNGETPYLKFDLRNSGINRAESAVLMIFDGDPPSVDAPFGGKGMHDYPVEEENTQVASLPCVAYAVEDDSWGEYTILPSNAPAAGAVVSRFLSGGWTWIEVDITDYVNGELADDQIVSLKLAAEGKGRRLRSTESANSPYLVVTPSASIEDTDTDHMADDWETRYFEDTETIQGADDTDGDGISDFFEYLGGSDPKDPDSNGFRIRPSREGYLRRLTFQWETAPGFGLGSHYQAVASYGLKTWSLLPEEHYHLETYFSAGKWKNKLRAVEDQGPVFFFRLRSPRDP